MLISQTRPPSRPMYTSQNRSLSTIYTPDRHLGRHTLVHSSQCFLEPYFVLGIGASVSAPRTAEKNREKNKQFFLQKKLGVGVPFLPLSLDSKFTSWDLKIRIPRRKLRIWSYSQVETRRYRSKYLKFYFLLVFFLISLFYLCISMWLLGLHMNICMFSSF